MILFALYLNKCVSLANARTATETFKHIYLLFSKSLNITLNGIKLSHGSNLCGVFGVFGVCHSSDILLVFIRNVANLAF